jgi:hypothetical protein
MKLTLIVFINGSNGQPAVHLPKKMFNEIPPNVDINIPKKYLKEVMSNKPKKHLWLLK